MRHGKRSQFAGSMPLRAAKDLRHCAAIARNGRGIWRDKPRHDSASHGSDAFQTLSVWWREMREEEPPEDLESRMRRQHAEHSNAMEKALKPKTLDEMLEEYDLEMAED
jgi:hypothetical protein